MKNHRKKTNDSAAPPNNIDDILDRVIASVENRQAFSQASSKIFETSNEAVTSSTDTSQVQSSVSVFGGPLTLQELNKLSLLCSYSSKRKSPLKTTNEHTIKNDETQSVGWESVDVDNLMNLCSMLTTHIESACHVDLIAETIKLIEGNRNDDEENDLNSPSSIMDSWLNHPGQGYHRLSILRSGLEASCILLSIIVTPNIDRRLIGEDSIEACITLFRQHLGKSIIMAMSNTGHLYSIARTKTTADNNKKTPGSGRKRKRDQEDDSNLQLPQDHSQKLKNTTKNTKQRMEALKKVYKPILATVGTLHVLMERIESLVQLVQLDDQPILSLASTALATFTIDPQKVGNTSGPHIIQVSALSLVFCIFQRYAKHRAIILEDLFPLMLKLPRSKKNMRTFPIRSSMTIYPSYPYFSLPENNNMIQPIVALILSLIQGCVTMPVNVENVNEEQNQPRKKEIVKLSNGLSDCKQVCNYFTVHLLRRCARKGEEGGASEFRPVLSNLIDDLLQLYLFPEYPAADLLLFSISRQVSHDLLKCSKTGPNALETTYIATAMDALGKICSGLAGCILANKNSPIVLFEERTIVKNEENKCFCGRTNLLDTFMLDCDRCHAWFHGSCVDITKDKLPEVWICDNCKMQMIVIEQTKTITERILRKERASIEKYQLDEKCVFQQLLLNYFSGMDDSKESEQTRKAREFHLAKWIQAHTMAVERTITADPKKKDKRINLSRIESQFMCKYFLEQWESQSNDSGHLSADGCSKLMLALAVKIYDSITSFPHFLGVLVKLMGDKLVPIRKLSVKAISQVISVDPNIMVQATVKDAVARRFSDESISVREAAVSLVGSFVLQAPLVAETFHFPILARLNDKGISVRKRAVRIFRDVLLSFPKYRGLVSACSKLLQLAANPKEDDSVRDLIHETFKELWFSEKSGVEQKCATEKKKTDLLENSMTTSTDSPKLHSDSAVVQAVPQVSPYVNPNIPSSRQKVKETNSKKENYNTRLRKASKQMIDVISSSKSTDFLEILVKDLLFGISGGKLKKMKENAVKLKFAQTHCNHLVDAIMEELLEFEEKRSVLASKSQQNLKKKVDEGQMLVAIISTLGAFCEASPSLVAKHLDVFLPYLKADNGLSKEDESSVIYSICRMITRVVPLLSKSDLQSLNNGGVCKDIENVTYKFGSVTFGSAIAALATLVNHFGVETDCAAKKNILKIGKTFYSYLFKTKDQAADFSTVKPNLRNNIHRALSVLGAICRHFHMPVILNSDNPNDETIAADPTRCTFLDPSPLNESNLFNACFACIMFYLKKNDAGTKSCALRALTGIFIARPRVILYVEEMGTIEEVMSDVAPHELQREALQCWKEILLAEERRIESGAAKEEMDAHEDITVSKRISGDQDGDSSIAGGVMTQHSPRLFELTTSNDPSIRYAAVDLIGHLLRQGLINPMETVPHLLALQGDVGAPDVRLLARKLLIIEGEKRPDMLRQRVCAGVRQAYLFQRIVYSNNKHMTAVVKEESILIDKSVKKENVCIFGPIFEESIKSSRVQRQGLIKSLLTLFTNDNQKYDYENNHDIENSSLNNAVISRNINKKASSMESSTGESLFEQIPMLSYAAQVLAHLPYSMSADPLFIIYHISTIVAVHGAELLDRFRQFLFPFQLANSEEDDIDHSMVDELERSVDKNSENWKKTRSIMESEGFDSTFFMQLCAEASALVLLMRLKKFLKKNYYLTDTRCMEYNPNEKEKIRDRTISRVDDIPLFDGAVVGIKTTSIQGQPEKNQAELYSTVQQYAEFRQLMREGDVDTKDESTDPDSDDGYDELVTKQRKTRASDVHSQGDEDYIVDDKNETAMKRRSQRLNSQSI